MPESVRWLTAKGRFAEARAAVAKQLGVPIASVPLPTTRPAVQPRAKLSELYSVNPRLFWQTVLIWGGSASAGYGYYLWGPTIVSLALHVTPATAAKYFIYVAGTAVIGKIIVSLIASKARPTAARHSVRVRVRACFSALAGYFNAASWSAGFRCSSS